MRHVIRLAPALLAAAALACAPACSEQKKEPLRTRLLSTRVAPLTACVGSAHRVRLHWAAG